MYHISSRYKFYDFLEDFNSKTFFVIKPSFTVINAFSFFVINSFCMLHFAVVLYSTLALVQHSLLDSHPGSKSQSIIHTCGPIHVNPANKTGQKYVHHKLCLFSNNRALLHSIVTAILGIQGTTCSPLYACIQALPAISCYVLIQSNMGCAN